MALIECPDCKSEVSATADKCLKCGRTINRKTGCITIGCSILLIPVFAVYFVVMAFDGMSSWRASRGVTAPAPQPAPEGRQIEPGQHQESGAPAALAAIMRGRSAVLRALPKPSEIQFDRTSAVKLGPDSYAVCGTFKSAGSASLARKFVVTDSATYIESSENEELFRTAWDAECTGRSVVASAD